MAKRMRLPNGFGQITRITGKRLRSPYRAMVTVGKDENTGKYKRKILGYYKSYNDAYSALLIYHNDPSIVSDMTFIELYDKWSKYHFPKMKKTGVHRSSFEKCSRLYNLKLSDIRMYHIKEVLEQEIPPSTVSKVKSLIQLMFDYAIENEWMKTNYARQIKIEKYKPTGEAHTAFSDDEMKILWANSTDEFVSIALIGIYSGFRPQELMDMKCSDVNIKEWTFTGGMKTEAGRDRVVPIHELIKPLVYRWHSSKAECLFRGYSYHHFYTNMIAFCERLHLNSAHRPHDTRKIFVTKCKKYNVDEYAIKRMVGHRTGDLTEDVYTERNVEWLRSELNKMV